MKSEDIVKDEKIDEQQNLDKKNDKDVEQQQEQESSALYDIIVKFISMEHPACITSQESAYYRNESLGSGAKVSLLRCELKDKNEMIMCVCSAAEEIHWNSIKKILKTKNIKLADELEMAEITYGCKKGAVPPFGSLFKHKVTVYLDQSLIDQGPTINFNAGMRTRSLRMSLQDYLLFENPLIFKFTKKYFL